MARGKKELVLQERDMYVLYLLDKFRVLDSPSITYLAGFTSDSYCITRLQKLARYEYIKRERLVATLPIVHYLTRKGNIELNDKAVTTKVKLATLEHELYVGKVASYISSKFNIDPHNFITDRELRIYEREINSKKVMERKGDLLFTKDNQRVTVEIEINFKGKDRQIKNIRRNKELSDKQIWFIPKKRKSIEKVLINENIPKEDIFYLEDIEMKSLKPRIVENSEQIEIPNFKSEIKVFFGDLKDLGTNTHVDDEFSKFRA